MSQSLSKITLHLVFSTKNRVPLLLPEIQPELHKYVATILQNINCNALEIDGVEDHLHILTNIGRTISVANVVKKVKAGSSLWLKTKGELFNNFYWQGGYAAFSVSESNTATVHKYISNQHEHHKKISFQDEIRALCRKHGVNFDERYIWD